MNKEPAKSGQKAKSSFLPTAIVLIIIIGVLAAIAIPNFLRFSGPPSLYAKQPPGSCGYMVSGRDLISGKNLKPPNIIYPRHIFGGEPKVMAVSDSGRYLAIVYNDHYEIVETNSLKQVASQSNPFTKKFLREYFSNPDSYEDISGAGFFPDEKHIYILHPVGDWGDRGLTILQVANWKTGGGPSVLAGIPDNRGSFWISGKATISWLGLNLLEENPEDGDLKDYNAETGAIKTYRKNYNLNYDYCDGWKNDLYKLSSLDGKYNYNIFHTIEGQQSPETSYLNNCRLLSVHKTNMEIYALKGFHKIASYNLSGIGLKKISPRGDMMFATSYKSNNYDGGSYMSDGKVYFKTVSSRHLKLKYPANIAAFSPDSKLLYAYFEDEKNSPNLFVYSLPDGRLVRHGSFPSTPSFTEENLLVFKLTDYTADHSLYRHYEPDNLQKIKDEDENDRAGGEKDDYGRAVSIKCENWNIENDSICGPFLGQKDVLAMAWSQDKKLVAIVRKEIVRPYKRKNKVYRLPQPKHKKFIKKYGNIGYKIQIMDLTTQRLIKEKTTAIFYSPENYTQHRAVKVLFFDRDRRIMLLPERPPYLYIWDLSDDKLSSDLADSNDRGIGSLEIGKTGNWFVTNHSDLWDSKASQQRLCFSSKNKVKLIAVSPGGRFAIASSDDNYNPTIANPTISIMDTETKMSLANFYFWPHQGIGPEAEFSPDMKWILFTFTPSRSEYGSKQRIKYLFQNPAFNQKDELSR